MTTGQTKPLVKTADPAVVVGRGRQSRDRSYTGEGATCTSQGISSTCLNSLEKVGTFLFL